MFKTMDPNLIRDLIKDAPDVLTPAAEEEEKFYRNAMCPMCYQRGAKKKIPPPKIIVTPDGPEVVESPWVDGQLLVQGYANCTHCDTDYDPYTGLIMHTEASTIASSQSDPLPT